MAIEPSTNLRYFIPAVPPLTLAAAWGATRLAARAGRARRAALALAATASLGFAAFAAVAMLSRGDQLRNDAGLLSSADYLRRELPSLGDVTEDANRLLAPGDRILFLFEARSFYFDTPVIPDDFASNWPRLARGLRAGVMPAPGRLHPRSGERTRRTMVPRAGRAGGRPPARRAGVFRTEMPAAGRR